MKVAHFDQIITPEVGVDAAGYGPNMFTVRIHDDLKLSILLLDDGDSKGAVLGYDLLGLDYPYIQKIRKDVSAQLGCPEANVILSCSHTHSGPHTRTQGGQVVADLEYIEKLYRWTAEGVAQALAGGWQEADTYFYSCKCDVNYNRRHLDGANHCIYLPSHRTMEAIANGFADQELGMLIFTKPGDTYQPIGVLLNYAAHPLASHAVGLGSHQISADFPGEVRNMIEADSCWCVFTDGAAGDQFPKYSECGWESVRKVASGIVLEALRGMCDACRNKPLYLIKEPKIHASIETVTLKLRRDQQEKRLARPLYAGKKETEAEIQLFALNDAVCLVGVPGEMFAEIGQEIKWHSPYRKAFILYNSTAYLSYLPNAGAYQAGGYEVGVNSALIQPFESLKIVNAAVDGMHKMYGPLPEELEN